MNLLQRIKCNLIFIDFEEKLMNEGDIDKVYLFRSYWMNVWKGKLKISQLLNLYGLTNK